jgi:hypothetical protein
VQLSKYCLVLAKLTNKSIKDDKKAPVSLDSIKEHLNKTQPRKN